MTMAFDKLPRPTVVNAMIRKADSIANPLDRVDFLACVRWFDAFLQGRLRRVRIGDAVTEWRRHECGLPQGTKLGPLGWIFATEGLCDELLELMALIPALLTLLYADDV